MASAAQVERSVGMVPATCGAASFLAPRRLLALPSPWWRVGVPGPIR